MWWPWFDQEAARDPLLRQERELLDRVIAAASSSPTQLSEAQLNQVLGVSAPR